MAEEPLRSTFTRTAQKAAETGTGPPAHALLIQCGLLPQPPSGSTILDNACGAGIVTARLVSDLTSPPEDLEVICGDLDQTMVDLTASRIRENGWSNVRAETFNALAVPYPNLSFTHILMNFGPQLVPDPIAVLKETHRLLRPSSTIGFTAWLSPGFIPSVREIIPSFTGPPSLSGPWTQPSSIQSTLLELGFTDISVQRLEFETDEEDVEAYLELMKLLLPKLLVGTKEGEEYEALMRGKKEKGEMRMQWVALVVSARKA